MAKRNLKDNSRRRSTTPRVDLESAANRVHSNYDDDDFEELGLKTPPPPPKIDINTMKNEILTDGMQVSASGYINLL